MLKCRLCKRQTEKGESTGHFIQYYKWKDDEGIIHKDIRKEIPACCNCVGEVLLK